MPNSFMCELVSSRLKQAFSMFYILFRAINFPARSNKNECVVKHAGLSTWESHLKVGSHGNIFITCTQSFLFGPS